jgi:hypothetical protein
MMVGRWGWSFGRQGGLGRWKGTALSDKLTARLGLRAGSTGARNSTESSKFSQLRALAVRTRTCGQRKLWFAAGIKVQYVL